jgi:hypothetical protein
MSLSGLFYYVITVKITSVGRPLHFPILSYLDDHGGRHFSNDIVGRTITVDKITWEDAQNFQQICGEILCGVYWDSGGNNGIGRMIRYLYDERKMLKALGNDAGQQVVKLLMNSAYGRTIMNPIETKMKFISGAEKITAYANRHAVSITTISNVRDDFAIVERQQSLYTHFAQPQIGAFILSMSKRIMNEVMVLAETLRAPIHYIDTDSMHIEKQHIRRLGLAFFEKYNRPLIAAPEKAHYPEICTLEVYEHPSEELGLFHGDFARIGGYEKPYSIKSVYCGKKMYMDVLVYEKPDEQGFLGADNLIKNHVRMKGIPTEALTQYVADHSDTIQDMHAFYLSILHGGRYCIDLLTAKRPFFVFTKSMETSSRKEFRREIGALVYQKERAVMEAEKSGFNDLLYATYIITPQQQEECSAPALPSNHSDSCDSLPLPFHPPTHCPPQEDFFSCSLM